MSRHNKSTTAVNLENPSLQQKVFNAVHLADFNDLIPLNFIYFPPLITSPRINETATIEYLHKKCHTSKYLLPSAGYTIMKRTGFKGGD